MTAKQKPRPSRTSFEMPAALLAEVEAYRDRILQSAGYKISLSEIFRSLIRKGLDAEKTD